MRRRVGVGGRWTNGVGGIGQEKVCVEKPGGKKVHRISFGGEAHKDVQTVKQQTSKSGRHDQDPETREGRDPGGDLHLKGRVGGKIGKNGDFERGGKQAGGHCCAGRSSGLGGKTSEGGVQCKKDTGRVRRATGAKLCLGV